MVCIVSSAASMTGIALGTRSASTPRAKPIDDGKRHRQDHQSQRVHALGPVIDDDEIGEAGDREEGELPAAGPQRRHPHQQHHRRPGQPLQHGLDGAHRLVEAEADGPEEGLEDAVEPVGEGVDHIGDGQDPARRICRDPIHALAQHQAEQREGDGRQPDQQARIDASCLGRRAERYGPRSSLA